MTMTLQYIFMIMVKKVALRITDYYYYYCYTDQR